MIATSIQNFDLRLITRATSFTAAHTWAMLAVYLGAQILIFAYPAVLYVLWRWPESDGRHLAAKKAVLIAVVAIVAALAVKSLVDFAYFRPRPFVTDPTLQALGFRVDPESFPSGHTMVAFAIASSLYLSGYKKLGWVLLAGAVIIGVCRVFAGVHYPTDVLAGALIAIAVSWYLHREASTLKRYLPTH